MPSVKPIVIPLPITGAVVPNGILLLGKLNVGVDANTSVYGKNVGGTGITGSGIGVTGKYTGVTTDPTKSGMIADLTNATESSNAIIKY